MIPAASLTHAERVRLEPLRCRAVAGERPANVVCDDLVAEIGATAGCTVTDSRGQLFGVIVEYIGGSARWQWSMA